MSPERIDSECRPPRSSGIDTGIVMRPSAVVVTFVSSFSIGSKPLPLTRLPFVAAPHERDLRVRRQAGDGERGLRVARVPASA